MIGRCSVELDSAPLRVVHVFIVIFHSLLSLVSRYFLLLFESVSALSLLLVLVRFWVVSIEYQFFWGGKLTQTIGTV